MLEELVSKVFAARNAAHLAHWRTKSFSQHMALGEFYDEAIEKIDGIVEAWQGANGKLIGPVKYGDADNRADIAGRLAADVNWIAANREKISQRVPAIENLLDDLADLYLHTIYKLKNLS